MDEDQKNSIARDGGWNSRKLWFCVFSVAMILAASRVAPSAAVSEVITGVVMVTGIFVTGNTIVKWRAGGLEQTKVDASAMGGPVGKIVSKLAERVEASASKIEANRTRITADEDEPANAGGPYVPPG